MKLLNLQGKFVEIDERQSKHPLRNREGCKSNLQFECGQLLKKHFPFDSILEELYIPDGFYLDYFLPLRKMAFEINGRQHDEYVEHFHGSKKGFARAKSRDVNKARWCLINNIDLYVVYSVDDMKEILQ